mgnify:CR=1 FL=1
MNYTDEEVDAAWGIVRKEVRVALGQFQWEAHEHRVLAQAADRGARQLSAAVRQGNWDAVAQILPQLRQYVDVMKYWEPAHRDGLLMNAAGAPESFAQYIGSLDPEMADYALDFADAWTTGGRRPAPPDDRYGEAAAVRRRVVQSFDEERLR